MIFPFLDLREFESTKSMSTREANARIPENSPGTSRTNLPTYLELANCCDRVGSVLLLFEIVSRIAKENKVQGLVSGPCTCTWLEYTTSDITFSVIGTFDPNHLFRFVGELHIE
jgi:hypothetical protein